MTSGEGHRGAGYADGVGEGAQVGVIVCDYVMQWI